MPILTGYWDRFQESLFPRLEAVIGLPVTERLKQVIRVIDVVCVERHVPSSYMQWMGRKRVDRRSIARAFIAKAVLNIPTTELLIDRLRFDVMLRRLCGFEYVNSIPSAATFSRAFAEFAQSGLGDRIHTALVQEYVSDDHVSHVARDSTAVEARERATPRTKAVKKRRDKRGRPRKGEEPNPRPPRRIPKQLTQDPYEAIAELPRVCDKGCKRDSGGNPHPWTGWKLHVDWTGAGIPLLAVTTSASVNDNQVAVPMMKITAGRVTSFYDLMDNGYYAAEILDLSTQLGHVPIIEPSAKTKQSNEDAWPEYRAFRYRHRTAAERGFSRLKEEFGLLNLRVRGHPKAHMHIMFGVLALFADALYNWTSA